MFLVLSLSLWSLLYQLFCRFCNGWGKEALGGWESATPRPLGSGTLITRYGPSLSGSASPGLKQSAWASPHLPSSCFHAGFISCPWDAFWSPRMTTIFCRIKQAKGLGGTAESLIELFTEAPGAWVQGLLIQSGKLQWMKKKVSVEFLCGCWDKSALAP